MLMANTVLFGVGAGLATVSWIKFVKLHGTGKALVDALLSMQQPMLLVTVAILLGGLFHSFTILYPALLKKDLEQLEALNIADDFRDKAYRDPLTGLHNRRFFDQAIRAYHEEFQSKGASFGLLFLDLDHFKNVNDTYGHDAGDIVLKEIALCLKALVREHDVLARIGGEEFAVIVTFVDNGQLPGIAERYRSQIESVQIDAGGNSINPTVSIGAALNKSSLTANDLFVAADMRLYEAKRAGRNRVSI